jgi:integrase
MAANSGTVTRARSPAGDLLHDEHGRPLWRLRFYDGTGTRRHLVRPFATAEDARAFVTAQREATAGGPTWADLARQWEVAHPDHSASQREKVARTIDRLLAVHGAGHLVAATTGQQVRDFIAGLAKASGPVAANHALGHLKAVARWGRGRLLIPDAIPWEHLAPVQHRGKATPPVPLELLPRLLDAVPPAAAPIVRWIALTGCRQQDAAGLRAADIGPDAAVLRVKGGRRLAYALDNDLRACLAAGRERCATASQWAFPTPQGGRWSPERLANTIQAAWAPLGPWRLHSLRHTFATLAGRLGMSADQIKAGLGHAARATSERYTHAHEDEAARAEVGLRVRAALFPKRDTDGTRTAKSGDAQGRGGTPRDGVGIEINGRKTMISRDLARKIMMETGLRLD